MVRTKAFILSLLVHAILLSIVVYLFFQEHDTCNETCRVITLSSIVEKVAKPLPPQEVKQPKPQQKTQKKVIQKTDKKEIKKNEKKVVKRAAVVEEIPHIIKESEKKVAEEVFVQEEQKLVKNEVLKPAPKEKLQPKISQEDKYINAHIQEIQALLAENLYYPRMARKRGIEGEVLVSFCILRSGKIENIRVVKSSRDILGRAAIRTIKNLSGLFPKPSVALTLNVPIRYSLQ